jgi:enoyl-CoA hydratase/carnithine racemase
VSSNASASLVLIEHEPVGDAGEHATILRLNRPGKLNAIDWDMIRALDTALDDVEADPKARCVLVAGNGRAFSAGGDLESYVTLQRDPVEFPRFVAELHGAFGRLRKLRVPAIALVNGVTAAGGLELVLNCDFALVARSARIGDAHLNYGQMGGGGVLTLLPRAIGRERAAELIFTGRFLSAGEAVEWGIANRVVDDDDLLATGLDLAREIATKSPLAIANAKDVLQSVWADNGPEAAGLEVELERNSLYCLTSEDAQEGLRAFQEKRRPRFQGR